MNENTSLCPVANKMMRRLLLLWLIVLLPFPTCRTWASGFSGEERQSLDGKWDFTIDPQIAGQRDAKWDSITVPGNWDTLPAYADHKGKGWYRCAFQVPPDWKGKRIRLRFEAINNVADVYLNDQEIGSHNGGYTPFEFDVTDQVRYGGANTLIVCADNSIQRGAWWHWGGISRSVNLIANNDVRLLWQHIQSDPDLSTGTAQISVQYKIANSSDVTKTMHLASKIADTAVPSAETDVTLPPRSETDAHLTFAMPKETVQFWDFDHPHLYQLNTTLSEKGAMLHAESDRFGIRKIEVKSDGLYLNGEKVRLTGFNRVSDSNQYGNTEPGALVRQDVDLMKSAGANMARLMHVPQAPNLLDYLDEKGMLIFEEIPVWGNDDPNVKPDNPLTRQWLREMIDRDYNHPCIMGWSPGNEISGHYAYVKSMHDYIRRDLDSSRLLSYVSNTASRSDYGTSNDPAGICDIIMINNYWNFAAPLETVHQRWPDKPIFFSEWGFSQIGAKPTATLPHFEAGLAKTVQSHPYLIGLSIWTFNDYRSGMKGTPASGNREWGVVDVQRRPKAAYDQVRKSFSPVHALTVANGKIRIEPRSPDEVPSYALRGYQLKWTTLTADGGEAQSGVIPVPDLKPGDPPWETAFTEISRCKVSLITPTGYDVADWEGQP